MEAKAAICGVICVVKGRQPEVNGHDPRRVSG